MSFTEKLTHSSQSRHYFMFTLSLVVIGVVLYVSARWGQALFDPHNTSPVESFLIPYLTNLGGILLFIMSTSRRKRETWILREYWGDHCFRIAQSFAYLFLIMWAWRNPGPESDVTLSTQVPLNIIGFLVGLFILRVERAVEGLGDKFEQVLMAILPRATQYITAEERRRQQLRTAYKIDEIAIEYGVLRGQIEDPAARSKLDELLDKATSALDGDDPDQIKAAADTLIREFGEARKGIGEILVPVEDLLTNKYDSHNK